LVDPASPVELRDAMIELYKNTDLRQSLGEMAFQKANTKFRGDKIAIEWEEFYQKVLSKAES